MITDFKIMVGGLVLTFAMLAFLAYNSSMVHKKCQEAGGMMIRTTAGSVCAEVKEIK